MRVFSEALYVGSHARAFRTTELRSQHNNNIGIKEKLLRYNPSSDTGTRGKGQWTHHSYPWNNNIHRANVDASDNRELLLRRKRSKRREGEPNLALRQASIGSRFLLVVVSTVIHFLTFRILSSCDCFMEIFIH